MHVQTLSPFIAILGSKVCSCLFFCINGCINNCYRIFNCTTWRRRRSSSTSSSTASTSAASTAAAMCPLHGETLHSCADRRCSRHALDLQQSPPPLAATPAIIGVAAATRSTSSSTLLHPQLLTHRSLPGDLPHRAQSPTTPSPSLLLGPPTMSSTMSPPASPTPPLSTSSRTPTRVSMAATSPTSRSPSVNARKSRHSQPAVGTHSRINPTAAVTPASSSTAATAASAPLRAPSAAAAANDRRRQTSLGSQPLPRPQPLESPHHESSAPLHVVACVVTPQGRSARHKLRMAEWRGHEAVRIGEFGESLCSHDSRLQTAVPFYRPLTRATTTLLDRRSPPPLGSTHRARRLALSHRSLFVFASPPTLMPPTGRVTAPSRLHSTSERCCRWNVVLMVHLHGKLDL